MSFCTRPCCLSTVLRAAQPSRSLCNTMLLPLIGCSPNTSNTTNRRFLSGSSSGDLVSTTLHPDKGIAEITMQNGPVNTLSLEMCQALSSSIKAIESDKTIQAMVLQSSGPTTFSAGLDIMEMHQPKMDRLRLFWNSFQQLYLTLYGSHLACIAAIEGHAPAAGCMLALSCDYRIMAETNIETKCTPKIGLNESKLGIVAPPWLAQQMIDCIGVRQAEMALSLGTLFSPEDALRIDLVDRVVPLSEVRTAAQQEAQKWAAIPPKARLASKNLVRKQYLDKLIANAEQDTDHFVGFVTSPGVQQNISGYLEMLTKKRK